MGFIDRLPPHSREAEAGVLGALLREGLAADGTFGELTPDDFYYDAHQKIFRVFRDYAAAGKTFDLVTCFEELVTRKEQADVGGAGFLADLYDAMPTAANLEYHADIVRERAVRRRLIHAACELTRDAYDGAAPAADLLERFYESALSTARTGKDPVTLTAALRQVMDGIDERNRPGGKRPLTTGFDALDNVLGGFRGGEFVLVGARPSVGKSALALALLLAAAEAGTPGLMFSLEMSAEEMASRVLAMKAEVPLNQIRGRLDDEKATARRLLDAVDRTRLPVWIDDRADHTVASIAGVCKRAVRRHRVGLVVIDYLQLLKHEGGKNDPQHVRVGDTSRRLKLLARTLDVPVVCLAQLNRESTTRTDGRPMLSDFRESGNLEQDCDVALLLWPVAPPEGPAAVGPPPAVQEVRICVEKQRNGPRTVVPLDYRRAFTRFETPPLRF